MIKLFPISDMKETVFCWDWSKTFLHQQGIAITEDRQECDLYVSNWLPQLTPANMLKFRLRNPIPKPILLWTHEPRYCTTSESQLHSFGYPTWHIMNLYNRNVFLDNHSLYGPDNIKSYVEPIEESELGDFTNKTIAAIATYICDENAQTLIKDGVNIDLSIARQNLMITGHKMGLVDIYGKKWPKDMNISSLPHQNGWQSKVDFLKQYLFNICMENTDFDYYVTEKIWHSISARCLPIYRGSADCIYEDFPRNSFIDYRDFESPEKLFEYISGMSRREYCDRLNMCIEVHNAHFENNRRCNIFHRKREDMMRLIVEKANDIVSGKTVSRSPETVVTH